MDLTAVNDAGPRTAAASRRKLAAMAALALLGTALVLWLTGIDYHGVSDRKPPSQGSHRGLSSLPLAVQTAFSGAVGGDERVYRIHASGSGLRATDPAQRLQAHFERSGVLLGSGATRVKLGLRAAGYGPAPAEVGRVAPRAHGNRVVYRHGALNEWYVNGPAGLEQGFTMLHAPSGTEAGPLTLSMALAGDVSASLAAGGRAITFSGTSGPSLRYSGLLATDASGKRLHSWLGLREGRVLVNVDTRRAHFPVRIDPLIQQGTKLTGSSETGEGHLGFSVALSADGNTALVGGYNDNSGVGAAWVFTRSGSTWSQQGSKLTGTGETGAGNFGSSVALSPDGNTALIGGPADNSGVGAVWAFTRSGSTWTQQGSKITATGETGAGAYGSSVALAEGGNTGLVGGPNDNTKVGAAWVLTRSNGTWAQLGSKLTGTGETGAGKFGTSVALSVEGNNAVIGGEADNTNVGAAWVFTSICGVWKQQGSKLTGTGETGEGHLGASVAMSANGRTALVGGPNDNTKAGAAWVFTRSAGAWTQQGSKLTGTFESGEGQFGASVALSADGNTALVGGSGDKEALGAAWEFTRSGTTWTQMGAKLKGAEETGKGHFASSVALSANGETGLAGGPADNTNVGAAWVLTAGFSSEESYGVGHSPADGPGQPVETITGSGGGTSGGGGGGTVGGEGGLNTATGNMAQTQTDLVVGGRGPGLHLTRTYNSQLAAQQTEPGPFGYGWTGSYSAHVVVNAEAERATVYEDSGNAVTFHLTSSGTYVGPGPWVQATLVKESSTYVYTLPDQTKLDFNSSGQLTSETDRDGNAVTVAYNAKGIETVTDGDSRKLTYAYNGGGQVESVKDPMGHTVKFTYESGKLATVTEPGEVTARWSFEYDASHEMTVETDGRSHKVKWEYDGSHRVTAETDAMERKTKLKYTETEAGLETTITEPNTSTTVEQFNNAHLPTSVTYASGTGIAAKTVYEYNGSNELIASKDPDEHTTEYAYSAAGDLTSVKDPNGDETKMTYNATHDVETETTPKGETTTIKRDAKGDPEVIERPAPGAKTQKTTYKYNSKGDVEQMTDALEHTWKYEDDAAGDVEKETDPEGNKTTRKYNEDSQETSEVSPRGNVEGAEASKFTTKIELNEQGQTLKVTDPLGHTEKDTYNGDGGLETTTDGNEHKTTITDNADNEETSVKEPNGTVVETERDAAGQVVGEIDGNKHKFKYERNLLEEVTEEVDPRERKDKAEYDAAGNLKETTDAKGRTATYKYDPGNRLTEISYSEGATHAVKYEYNKDNDVTKMTDGTGETIYTYDELERLTETKDGHGDVVKYEYNLGNEPTKITYPNGEPVTHAYDKDDRLESVTDWHSHTTKFSYDNDSDLKATIFPTETKDEDAYKYNEADQLTEVKITREAETLASLAYTRDNDGQLKKTTQKGLPGEESIEDTYDENNRLIKAGTLSYEYDAANNPTKVGANTYSYDKADELEKGTGVTSYGFDELGERIKRTPTSGPATTYGYNQAGVLTSVEQPKGAEAEIKDSYAYNGNGLRTSQTISGTTTYMAWDEAEGLPLLLNDGTNSYIYGPAGPIEQISGGGEVLYMHHDQQGSTRMLTGSTGKSEGTATYDAYGNVVGTTGKTTSLGYDGQYTSSDTGLIYLRARVYDPVTAQFISVDPAEGETGEPYGYAGDDPVNADDPTGMQYNYPPRPGDPSSAPPSSAVIDAIFARQLERMRQDAASQPSLSPYWPYQSAPSIFWPTYQPPTFGLPQYSSMPTSSAINLPLDTSFSPHNNMEDFLRHLREPIWSLRTHNMMIGINFDGTLRSPLAIISHPFAPGYWGPQGSVLIQGQLYWGGPPGSAPPISNYEPPNPNPTPNPRP
jgi:RHS repeat-associated protein